jgi:hypothetical protein
LVFGVMKANTLIFSPGLYKTLISFQLSPNIFSRISSGQHIHIARTTRSKD